MIKHLQKNICALAVLSATSLPVMAESIDVRVTGTITPAACTPSLTGDGTVDYGTILGDTLNVTSYTVLEKKSLNFTLTCDAPTQVALKTTDARPGTAVAPVGSTVLDQVVTASTDLLGLGQASGKNIGAFAMSIPAASVSLDGVNTNVQSLSSADSGITWAKDSSDWVTNTTDWHSWSTDNSTTPTGVTNLSGTIDVQAIINKTSELDLSQEVALDGLATLEVRYL